MSRGKIANHMLKSIFLGIALHRQILSKNSHIPNPTLLFKIGNQLPTQTDFNIIRVKFIDDKQTGKCAGVHACEYSNSETKSTTYFSYNSIGQS